MEDLGRIKQTKRTNVFTCFFLSERFRLSDEDKIRSTQHGIRDKDCLVSSNARENLAM